MSKSHSHRPAPVPPGNRPQSFQGTPGDDDAAEDTPSESGAGFNEQDPKRRLGGFESAGEHARQQPGPLNDGGRSGK